MKIKFSVVSSLSTVYDVYCSKYNWQTHINNKNKQICTWWYLVWNDDLLWGDFAGSCVYIYMTDIVKYYSVVYIYSDENIANSMPVQI